MVFFIAIRSLYKCFLVKLVKFVWKGPEKMGGKDFESKKQLAKKQRDLSNKHRLAPKKKSDLSVNTW